MVIVTSGLNPKGEPCEFYLDENLKNALDEVKSVVGSSTERGTDWDYIALVCGNPGVGKSNFAQSMARYCCEWFDESYICFTAEEFIHLTNTCKDNSAIILDESFAALNTRVSKSSDFVKIINHIQLIRQKNLYVFLCLPNFFDLAKGVAIYRSQHLFVCYSPKYGQRGSFAAFDRDSKKNLYILGSKFMNYNATRPNFRGRFTKSKCIDQEKYEALKRKHLMDQGEVQDSKNQRSRDLYIKWLSENTELSHDQIAAIGHLTRKTIYNTLHRLKELEI